MTTFTRIHEDESPSIGVDVSKRLSKIGKPNNSVLLRRQLLINLTDPNIYGGFTECVFIFFAFVSIFFAVKSLFKTIV